MRNIHCLEPTAESTVFANTSISNDTLNGAYWASISGSLSRRMSHAILAQRYLWVPIVYLNHAPDGPRNSPADSPKIPGAPILH